MLRAGLQKLLKFLGWRQRRALQVTPSTLSIRYPVEHLIPRLNLVVSSNDLSVRRGNTVVIRAALASIRDTLLLRGRSSLARGGGVLRAVVHVVATVLGLRLRLRLLLVALRALDVDVGNTAALAIIGDGLVLVGRLGEFGNDVPGVKEARNVSEDAEQNVDERVCAADSALDPD